MCCTSNRSLFLTDDLMSFSQVDDLYADLIQVSKMPVDQPPVPIVLIYFVSHCAIESAQFQDDSFSRGGDLHADLIHVSKRLVVDQLCTDCSDLFSRYATQYAKSYNSTSNRSQFLTS